MSIPLLQRLIVCNSNVPELPEVETVCRGLNRATLGRVIEGGQALLERSIASPFPLAEFWAGLTGCAIARWQRRGKYLLAELSPGGWLGVHLRMSGQLLWCDRAEPLQKHARVRFFFAPGEDATGASEDELRFVDTRTFGKVWWVPSGVPPAEIVTGLQVLGPEPFAPEFNVAYLQERFRGRKRAIKAALLDQALVAGIGNIYADETLFVSRINPQRPVGSLTLAELQRLQPAIATVLQAGIDCGGTTFSSFRNLHGVNGNYFGQAWTYGRTGEPCRECGTAISRVKIAGRSSHYCPQCQR